MYIKRGISKRFTHKKQLQKVLNFTEQISTIIVCYNSWWLVGILNGWTPSWWTHGWIMERVVIRWEELMPSSGIPNAVKTKKPIFYYFTEFTLRKFFYLHTKPFTIFLSQSYNRPFYVQLSLNITLLNFKFSYILFCKASGWSFLELPGGCFYGINRISPFCIVTQSRPNK